MKVHAPDGTKWRVGRRVLPWVTRFGTIPSVLLMGFGLLLSEAFFIGLVVLAFAIPMILVLLVSWLLSVLFAPFLLLVGRKVVAYRLGSDSGAGVDTDDRTFAIRRPPEFKIRRFVVASDDDAQRLIADLRARLERGEGIPATEPS
ncbi:MAG TPA: hypothetical protein VE172_20920 [Stackebrandtia sp.]|uniref:hypothetical protein n=1 Tax=Stackebrandtia sp. TaxID=2023065 RepID=UPI002D5616A3|nr:hypothetical protein [Stackebrandtia sp.]HZE41271.1 hypothetical protein [Stackebrandtia sp.]